MRLLITFFLILNVLNPLIVAQEKTVELSENMFESHQRMPLANLDGWVFKKGNNSDWAKTVLNTSDWKVLKISEINTDNEDKNGRIEGWFRIKLKVASSLSNIKLGINRELWAATDVYIDGKLVASFGDTSSPYKAFNPTLKMPIPIDLKVGEEYILAIHLVASETTLTQRELRLKPENLKNFINITGPAYSQWVSQDTKRSYGYGGLCIGVSALLFLLFWLLVFINPKQRIFRLIAILSTFVLLYAVSFFMSYFYELSYTSEKTRFLIMITMQAFTIVFGLLILEWVLIKKPTRFSMLLIISLIITSTIAHIFSVSWPFGIIFTTMLCYLGYLLVTHRKKIKGAELAVIASIVIPTITMAIYINLHKYSLHLFYEYDKPLTAFTILGAPFMLVIYISMRFKEILKDVEEEAQKVIKISEEKKEILANQNKLLEQQVIKRTSELKDSFENLKATQSQLVQAEKMASLGELTAGIAHEIQNPLNFVNNFSEVSNELIDEMNEELDKGDIEEAKAISTDIKQNLEKINHHGKRADGIVKGMLQHSSSGTGKKEPTDINKLTNEYFRLAYHGLRAKDKSFNATLESNYDENIGEINIIPQDIGRVILNLFTNAFYAVDEKQSALSNGDLTGLKSFQPTVSVSTKKLKGNIEITVKDNGNGIPKDIIDKIFQPFFTTKPTGKGTGLGLSMSYDIIKAHNGELKVETEKSKYTKFKILLPITKITIT